MSVPILASFESDPSATSTYVVALDQIAVRLREAREQRGMTQHDVAALTDIRENSIGRFERGDMLPKTDSVLALCAALDVTPDWLLLGRTGGDDVAQVAPDGLDTYLASGEASSLTPEERGALADMGRAIQRAGKTPTPFTYAALAGILRTLTPAATKR